MLFHHAVRCDFVSPAKEVRSYNTVFCLFSICGSLYSELYIQLRITVGEMIRRDRG